MSATSRCATSTITQRRSKANATWEGDLVHGKGSFSLDSGAAGPLPITWAARVERLPGSTSPEEMIAGAHAACYAMAFSNVLGTKGTPATVGGGRMKS